MRDAKIQTRSMAVCLYVEDQRHLNVALPNPVPLKLYRGRLRLATASGGGDGIQTAVTIDKLITYIYGCHWPVVYYRVQMKLMS